MPCKSMDESTLRSLLNLESEKSIERIQVFDEIDSTNSEALRQLQAGKTENRVVVAASQTAGRGRRGRQWLSPQHAGLYLSLTRRFTLGADALQALSLVTAISVLEALVDSGVAGLELKWPNDVLFEGKKLAGILLELQQMDGVRFVVFGIGVNIQLSEEAKNSIERPVTDLSALLGELPSRVVIMAAVLNSLCQNLASYEERGFAPFEERWNRLDCYRQHAIEIQNGESRLLGKSLGVDAAGSLLLETPDGIQAINGGEVFPSLRPRPE